MVKKYVEENLKTDKGKAIVKDCAEPRTKGHLISQFNFNSPQALDHHLKPLIEADLLRQKVQDDGTIVFEWSNLFRRLSKSTIRSILRGIEIVRGHFDK